MNIPKRVKVTRSFLLVSSVFNFETKSLEKLVARTNVIVSIVDIIAANKTTSAKPDSPIGNKYEIP